MVSASALSAAFPAALTAVVAQLPAVLTGTATRPEIRDPASFIPLRPWRRGAGAARIGLVPARAPQLSEEDLPQVAVAGHAPHHLAENRDAAAVRQARLDLLPHKQATGAATARAALNPAAAVLAVAAVVVATPSRSAQGHERRHRWAHPAHRTPLTRRQAACRTGGGCSPAAFRSWGGTGSESRARYSG